MKKLSDQMRRRWKLAALKEFATLEPVSTLVISKNIGEDVLEELLHQSFSMHPLDPALGARNLLNCLFEQFGERFKHPVLRRPYMRRTAPGTELSS